MTTEKEKVARQMPKGGRKGGTVFPRVALSDAIGYARKLVSKTHVSPQPKELILSGVVGAKTGIGDVRMSALKQYGFLKGDTKSHFSADELAKRIAAAPSEELILLYRQAILKPAVFKKLFDTFHGDTVSKAKLKQRAADLKVHPDETARCVELYASGMMTAGLVEVDGDQIKHLASSDVTTVSTANVEGEVKPETTGDGSEGDEAQEAPQTDIQDASTVANGADDRETVGEARKLSSIDQSRPRAVFNVNVTLDSSLDIEKLQKQLELLKRFGAI